MIAGQEAAWAALRKTQVEASIAAECGALPQAPNCIDGLLKGLSNADIPFLTSNIQVLPTSMLDSLSGPVTGTGTIT